MNERVDERMNESEWTSGQVSGRVDEWMNNIRKHAWPKSILTLRELDQLVGKVLVWVFIDFLFGNI